MKIAIIGFGREGQALLNFIRKAPQLKHAKVWVLDKNPKTKVPRGVRAQLGRGYLKGLEKFDLVFRSPGVPYTLSELTRARKHGVKFSNATRLFLESCPTQNIVGVTGTKGKSTTSTLIYEMLRAGGYKVKLAGNIGLAALGILPKLNSNSWVVLELSSFQLQDLSYSPRVAVVLDVFPDHLDAHGTLKEYYQAKANIARFQKSGDLLFYFLHNAESRKVARLGRARKIAVSDEQFSDFSPQGIQLPGLHNFRNAVMAATVAKNLGVKPPAIRKVLQNFRGVAHRLELVRKLSGVRWYDDSASTNPQTTVAAIRTFPDENKILIAGGADKNLNYASLAQALPKSGTKLIILFGKNKTKIKSAIRAAKVPIVTVKTLTSAIGIANRVSPALGVGVVLLSPGATSFDMFRNYAERGEEFKKLVRRLK